MDDRLPICRFYLWPRYCLSFCNKRFLITPVVRVYMILAGFLLSCLDPLVLLLTKTFTLFAAYPVSTSQLRVRTKTACLGIKTMCPSREICLPRYLIKCSLY